MPLETGAYISDLVVTNPDGGDLRTFADNHLKLIKKTIKQSFSGITGAVSITQTELNYLDGLTSNIQTQLNAKHSRADTSANSTVTINPSSTQVIGYTADDNAHALVSISSHDTTLEVINGYLASTTAIYYIATASRLFGATAQANVVIQNNYATTQTVAVTVRLWA